MRTSAGSSLNAIKKTTDSVDSNFPIVQAADGNEWVMAGPKKLRVPGGEHANPVIVDWDGDGLWDMVSGAGDGGVYWYLPIRLRFLDSM